jgi:hypothetical protein
VRDATGRIHGTFIRFLPVLQAHMSRSIWRFRQIQEITDEDILVGP